MPNTQTEEVIQNGASFDQALRFHLSSRMYPPVNPVFDAVIKQAISNYAAGDEGEELELPNGHFKLDVAIVQELHLEPFVEAVMAGTYNL